MYPVPAAYKTAIDDNNRIYNLAGTLTLKDDSVYALSDASFLSGTVSVSYDCVTGEELALGAAMAASLKATLVGFDFDRYALYEAQIVLNFVLGTTTVPLGIFTVTEAILSGKTLVISAIDDMHKTDEPMNSDPALGQPHAWLTELCNKCGLQLAQTKAQIEALPNGKMNIEMPKTNSAETWRDVLCYITQVLAGFAAINRAGKLEIRNFGTTPVATIPRARCYSLAPADYVSHYASLSCESGTDVIVINDGTDDGLNLAVRENPFFDVGESADHYRTVAYMYNAIKPLSYVPGQWSYAGNPALDAGDLVTIDGQNTLLTGITFKYHAPQDLRSAGANPRYGSIVPVNEKRQHDNKVLTLEEIERIRGELIDVNAQIIRTQNNIQLWVQNSYVAVADYFSKISELQTFIEQNADSINLRASELSEIIANVDDTLTNRFNSLETSVMIDTAGVHVRKSINGDLGKYEVFIDESSFRIRAITSGAPPSDPSADTAAVAWIDDDEMHIYSATIVDALTIGGYKIQRRDSGNLSITWVG